jgi:hypothetical protein
LPKKHFATTLADAMTPDELPSPPRKVSWKRWTLVLACVLAIAVAVLFLKTPTPEPVSVWFVRSTNYNGQKMLLFKGTNGLPERIVYGTDVTTRAKGTIRPNPQSLLAREAAFGVVGAGTTFTFLLVAPPEDATWTVRWNVPQVLHQSTRWDVIRSDCFQFLRGHGMASLTRPFWRTADSGSIEGTYTKE